MIGILTNFGPGFGPLVRTFDMARSIRKKLELNLGEPVKIIVPWVYGEDQLRILKEEASDEPNLWGNVSLSYEIGDALRPLLFSGKYFNEELRKILGIYKKQKKRLTYKTQTCTPLLI